MSPTMKLRQVQRGWRQIGPLMIGGPANRDPVYVIQQWWEEREPTFLGSWKITGEWRDIPIETEK
jgi:hypothetical protein